VNIKALYYIAIMAKYLKRLNRREVKEEEHYHWNKDCEDYPLRGKETLMIFAEKPSHITACPKCEQLDKSNSRR
jgi:hypothetical protein